MLLPETYVGQAAGVATSLLWTATSLLFAAASRRIGPTWVNGLRILIAIVLLGLTHRLFTDHWIPVAMGRQVGYLAVSGVIGLCIGDQALFHAFLDIGPRLTMLVMTTSPIFAVLFGWVVLQETLHVLAWAGIAVTIGGVAWVVVERPHGEPGQRTPHRLRGLLLAMVGAVCQAGGLLLSKQGMGHGWLAEEQHLDPQTATLIRMVFAGLGVLPIVLVRALGARRKRVADLASSPRSEVGAGMALTCGGAVTGPFLGVWMSLVASDRAPLAVAQTLCSLAPVFILPFSILLYKEHISRRAVIGAIVAVGGSALLFLLPT